MVLDPLPECDQLKSSTPVHRAEPGLRHRLSGNTAETGKRIVFNVGFFTSASTGLSDLMNLPKIEKLANL